MGLAVVALTQAVLAMEINTSWSSPLPYREQAVVTAPSLTRSCLRYPELPDKAAPPWTNDDFIKQSGQ